MAGARVYALGRDDYDLMRRDEIDRMLSETRPSAVIHLAAVVGGIGANNREPGRFFYDNAVMGIELLEACRLAGTGKAVIAGTVCAYPKMTALPFREAELWSGYPEETNAPYGLAKKMLLVQAQAYRAQYGSNFIYLLPVNLYGPGDNFDLETGHVIPAMIRKFLAAAERRHDEDAAEAFRLALRIPSAHRVGCVEAERSAAADARHHLGTRALRIRSHDRPAIRARTNDRVVSNHPRLGLLIVLRPGFAPRARGLGWPMN